MDRLPVITAVGLPPSNIRSPLIHEDDRQSPMLSGGLQHEEGLDSSGLVVPQPSQVLDEEGNSNTAEGVLTGT